MRTLGPDALIPLGGNECFPGCFFYDTNPRRFKRALKPLVLVFLTACFAAYLSHTFQSDMKYYQVKSPGIRRSPMGSNEDSFGGIPVSKINDKFNVIEKSASDLISSIKNIQDDLYGIKSVVKGGLNQEMVKQTEEIIKKHLQIYDADKTGITDYALENLGGCIVSVRDTVTYKEGSPLLTMFGYPLLTVMTEPKNIIQPKMNPGDCWAIKGKSGTAVIKLISEIYITAITIEHISKRISPTGDISSAPKEVTLLGLERLNDKNPHNFGKFEYSEDGPAIQTYPVKEPAFGRTFGLMEVKIESNHGNPQFTCVYRIRIHGRPPDLKQKSKEKKNT